MLCLKPNTLKPQKLYIHEHKMQNVPLNEKSSSPLIQANTKSTQDPTQSPDRKKRLSNTIFYTFSISYMILYYLFYKY